jgi:hypothetical protein
MDVAKIDSIIHRRLIPMHDGGAFISMQLEQRAI